MFPQHKTKSTPISNNFKINFGVNNMTKKSKFSYKLKNKAPESKIIQNEKNECYKTPFSQTSSKNRQKSNHKLQFDQNFLNQLLSKY